MSEKLEYEDFLESGAYVKKLEETYNRYLDARDKKLVEFMKENKRLRSIIKEVREYITSYESIETIQQFDHNKNNKDLDYSTIDEMTRRYMMVHDKILKILDEENI